MPMNQKGHELFISRLYDMQETCLGQDRTIVTSFLTPAQQNIAKQIIKAADLHFDGGFENAERKAAVISQWDASQADIVCLYAAQNPRLPQAAHPDVLGPLLHSGISREMIGDILTREDSIYIFCKEQMAEYICREIRQIKKQNVQFCPVSASDLPEVDRQEIQVNVSSLRYDSVTAALAHCSRSQADRMIRQGMVKVNDIVLEDNGKLCNNDHVSIRRCGRFLFLGVEKTTRKDRLILKFQKYS